MNIARIPIVLCFFLILTAVSAHADLDGFLSGLNSRARSDIDDYGVRLSVQFGVPQPQVYSLIRSVAVPADAFMCLQLGQMLRLPPERILQTYNANRGKGWGVIAKELGIKPGSAEFHALKRGDFALTSTPGTPYGKTRGPYGDEYVPGNDHGQGQGQGKNKDKGNQGKGNK
jgi:hypothetical protein